MSANQRLAARLTALAMATPKFQVERGSTPRKAPVFVRARGRRRGTLLACALLLVGLAATYPAIGEDVLQWAGLRASQVEPLTGTAKYGEGTITVSGGYADGINTVLFIGLDRISCTPFLTDQFGVRYEIEGGLGAGIGPYPAIFEPFRGQAAESGAVVTVHCVVGLHDASVRLRGTLVRHPAHALEVPADQVIDGTSYHMVSLRWSGTYLEIHTLMSGKLIDDLMMQVATITPQPKMTGVTLPGVFLASGGRSAEVPVAWNYGLDQHQELRDRHVLDELRVFRANHTGAYRVVVTTGGPDDPAITSWTVNVR
jgi:hypothetical protein